MLELPSYVPVAVRLGFHVLDGQEAKLGGKLYYRALRDFDPALVDGGFANLAAAELGIAQVTPPPRSTPTLVISFWQETAVHTRRSNMAY